MIRVSLPLAAKQEAITQPVAMSILKDIKLMLLGDLSLPVRVSYKSTDLINKNWMLGNIKRNDLHKTHDRMLTAAYKVTHDQNIAVTKLSNIDTLPSVYDEETGLTLKPVRMGCIGSLEINIMFKSKGELEQVVSKLRRRLLLDKHQSHHRVNYIYHLPSDLRKMMHVFALYREDVLGEQESYIEYLNRVADGKITYITDQSNQGEIEIGFKETLTGVLGYFDTAIMNLEMTFDKGTGYWSTDFSYIYHYDTIDSLELTYLSVIYNKLIPKEYRSTYARDARVTGYSAIGQACINDSALYMKELVLELERDNQAYIHIPEEDKHVNIRLPKIETPIFSALCLINKDDRKSLFNLNELGFYGVKHEILNFIRIHAKDSLFRDLESLFKITLYDEYGTRIPAELTMDDELNISSVNDLSLTTTHRAMFSIINDTKLLRNDAYRYVVKEFPVLGELVNVLDANVDAYSLMYPRPNVYPGMLLYPGANGIDLYPSDDIFPEPLLYPGKPTYRKGPDGINVDTITHASIDNSTPVTSSSVTVSRIEKQ